MQSKECSFEQDFGESGSMLREVEVALIKIWMKISTKGTGKGEAYMGNAVERTMGRFAEKELWKK